MTRLVPFPLASAGLLAVWLLLNQTLSFGQILIGGAIALIIGAVMLIEPEARGYGVSLAFIIGLGAVSAIVVFSIVAMAAKARKRRVVSGREQMLGASGVVLEDMQNQGWARVHGESWHVVSATPLVRGQPVRVTGIEGLTLSVEPEQTPP